MEVSPAQPGFAGSSMSVEEALRETLRAACRHDMAARGLRECVKALDRRQAMFCVLAESCNEPAYVKLIEGLCSENSIDLIKVADSKKLGQWVGFCKQDKNGDVRKVVGCSCVVVREFPEETLATRTLMDHFKALSA